MNHNIFQIQCFIYIVVPVNMTIKHIPVSSVRNGNVCSEEMQNKLLSSFAFQKCVVGVTQSTTAEGEKV